MSATKHPLRPLWRSMIDRCTNPDHRSWPHYGGRGITVCPRWLQSFEAFILDMGPRPAGTSIDRINNDGNYEPSNCRWATALEQARNKTSNLKLTCNGETKTVAEWALVLGVPATTIYSRHARGWPLERTVTAKRELRANERNAAMTECKYGHPFTHENTIVRTTRGRTHRRCKICLEAYQRAYFERRKHEQRA